MRSKRARNGVSAQLLFLTTSSGSLGGGNERADVGAGPGRFSPPSSNVLKDGMGGHAMLPDGGEDELGCGDV